MYYALTGMNASRVYLVLYAVSSCNLYDDFFYGLLE